MTLRPVGICLVVANTLISGGALAEGAGQEATTITANYGVYWAGLRFGDVRLDIIVSGSRYKMRGSGRFSVMGGLIYEWRGSTTSAGKLTESGPEPSLYTLSYSGGDKHGDVRISFADGGVSAVSMSPKKRPNPKNIPVTKEQLRGVLDPMTGAFLRGRPDLPDADLKVCDETIPAFDGKLRFDVVLVPKQQSELKARNPMGIPAFLRCAGLSLFLSPVSVPAIAASTYVFARRPDRGLARAAAGHCDVLALSNFRTDVFWERFGGDALVPSGALTSTSAIGATQTKFDEARHHPLLTKADITSRN